MTSPNRFVLGLAAVALAACAGPADAQQFQFQPQFQPGGVFRQPQAQPKAGPIVAFPQINTMPGIPAWQINPPVYNPGPFFNPALNNPWLNQTRFVPINPFPTTVFAPNNLFVNQPFNNPFNNPLVNQPFNNPFLQPFNNPFNSPFLTNPLNQNPFLNVPVVPPVAIQQPGQLLWRGPDLQVNPWSGTVYKPLSGVARTADGSTFFRVPGTGLPTFTGAYAPGTGLYYNPAAGTFLNPASGVISRPGVTNVFIPWLP